MFSRVCLSVYKSLVSMMETASLPLSLTVALPQDSDMACIEKPFLFFNLTDDLIIEILKYVPVNEKGNVLYQIMTFRPYLNSPSVWDSSSFQFHQQVRGPVSGWYVDRRYPLNQYYLSVDYATRTWALHSFCIGMNFFDKEPTYYDRLVPLINLRKVVDNFEQFQLTCLPDRSLLVYCWHNAEYPHTDYFWIWVREGIVCWRGQEYQLIENICILPATGHRLRLTFHNDETVVLKYLRLRNRPYRKPFECRLTPVSLPLCDKFKHSKKTCNLKPTASWLNPLICHSSSMINFRIKNSEQVTMRMHHFVNVYVLVGENIISMIFFHKLSEYAKSEIEDYLNSHSSDLCDLAKDIDL